MGPYASLCVLMIPNGSLWIPFVFMDSNGYLLVLICPYASLLFFMGVLRSLCAHMKFNVSLWFLIGPFAFLWVLINLYASS